MSRAAEPGTASAGAGACAGQRARPPTEARRRARWPRHGACAGVCQLLSIVGENRQLALDLGQPRDVLGALQASVGDLVGSRDGALVLAGQRRGVLGDDA